MTCMQRAMAACRKLDFPPDTLASSELKIKDLRHNLDIYCSDDVTRAKPSPDKGKSRPYKFYFFYYTFSARSYRNIFMIKFAALKVGVLYFLSF